VAYCLVCQLYFFKGGGGRWSFSLLLQGVVAGVFDAEFAGDDETVAKMVQPNIVVG
jgi:hypothetical protein